MTTLLPSDWWRAGHVTTVLPCDWSAHLYTLLRVGVNTPPVMITVEVEGSGMVQARLGI